MATKVVNINIGLLGHIDSGKTSLAKALSTTQSTSCYDKNPQSRERGITIDLGFSSLSMSCPTRLLLEMSASTGQELAQPSDWCLQMTFVDSPGHSSLIKTIIGGAQIIDIMVLVVDVMKGIQTQTAECLVIGEITCDQMVVVLNKVDLIDENQRETTVEKMSKKIAKTLEKTKFKSSPIVAVAAHPSDGSDGSATSDVKPIGIQHLLDTICDQISYPKRSPNGELILSVDHCFLIRGSGTVMTGTIIQGSIAVNDNIEIPSVKAIKKVKSMQMFHQKIERAIQGDRVGVCVTQFDPKLLERGVVCSPGFMSGVYAVITTVNTIAYYKGKYATKAKFHISVLHETVIAKSTFFKTTNPSNWIQGFDFDSQYSYEDELPGNCDPKQYYVLLEFERPVILNTGALYIASKLDTDIHANVCRLAFYGNVLKTFCDKNYVENDLQNLKVFKMKSKEGIVERVSNEYEVIVKHLLKKETNVQKFVGLKVVLSPSGEEGVIEGGFGRSGKVKIRIPNGVQDKSLLTTTKSKRTAGETTSDNNKTNANNTQIKALLHFKRYIYDSHKKMIQN